MDILNGTFPSGTGEAGHEGAPFVCGRSFPLTEDENVFKVYSYFRRHTNFVLTPRATGTKWCNFCLVAMETSWYKKNIPMITRHMWRFVLTAGSGCKNKVWTGLYFHSCWTESYRKPQLQQQSAVLSGLIIVLLKVFQTWMVGFTTKPNTSHNALQSYALIQCWLPWNAPFRKCSLRMDHVTVTASFIRLRLWETVSVISPTHCSLSTGHRQGIIKPHQCGTEQKYFRYQGKNIFLWMESVDPGSKTALNLDVVPAQIIHKKWSLFLEYSKVIFLFLMILKMNNVEKYWYCKPSKELVPKKWCICSEGS